MKPLMVALTALFLVALSASDSEGCFRLRCCKPAGSANRYVEPDRGKPCRTDLGYHPMACVDNVWTIVSEADRVGCLHISWHLQPCTPPRAIPAARSGGCPCDGLYPMKCDARTRTWRSARWCERPDGYLPAQYFGEPCCPPTR